MNPGCSLLVWSRNRGTLKKHLHSTYHWLDFRVLGQVNSQATLLGRSEKVGHQRSAERRRDRAFGSIPDWKAITSWSASSSPLQRIGSVYQNISCSGDRVA